MATQAELQFLISVNNQASAAIAQIGQALNAMGGQANTAQQGLLNMTLAMNGLNNASQVLSRSVGEIESTLRDATDAFAQYEQRMSVVAKVTGNSEEAMGQFEEAFDSMVVKLKGGSSVDFLANVAGQAAQLGIHGSADILQFTEVLSKMANTTTTVGEQGAKDFAKVLFVTGETAKSAEHFASVLTALGKQSAATEGVILHTTATIAQSTAQFKIGAESLLGLSSAVASLGLAPQRFGSAMDRILISLRDNAIGGSVAMNQLSAASGMTAEQWQKLIKDDPTVAFLKFASVFKTINDAGKSTTGMLTAFKLQGQDNIRDLGSMAEHMDEFIGQLNAARNEVGSSSLDQENAKALETLNKHIQDLENSWTLLKVSFGGALAPELKDGLDQLAVVMTNVKGAFDGLSPSTRSFTAWALIAIPIVLALAAAGSALVAALSFIGAVPIAIASAVAATTVAAYEIYANWDKIKAFFSQPISDIAKQSWQKYMDFMVSAALAEYNFAVSIWEKITGLFSQKLPLNGVQDIVDKTAAIRGDRQPIANRANPSNLSVDSLAKGNSAAGVSSLSPENEKIIEGLDSQSKVLKTLISQETALKALRALAANDEQARSDFDKARLQGLIDLEKLRGDATASTLRTLNQQAAAVLAITQDQKNALAVETALRGVVDKQGAIDPAQGRSIIAAVLTEQQNQQTAAIVQTTFEMGKQLLAAAAITQAQKNSVALEAQVLDYKRQHGTLDTASESSYRSQITMLQQISQLMSTVNSLDAIGSANRKYQDDLATLNQGKASGAISSQYYDQLKKNLDTQTLSARDPIAAQVKSMNDMIASLKIEGDYLTADKQTLSEQNSFRDKGVQLTAQQVAAMQDYNRAIQDANKSQSSGLEGWSKNIGTMRDDMLDLEKSFATGLSGAISGALQGQTGTFQKFALNISNMMINASVNQMMKGIIGNDNTLGGLFPGLGSKDALGNAANAANKLKGLDNIATQMMNVNATNVTIAGNAALGNITPNSATPITDAVNNNKIVGANGVVSGVTTPVAPASNDNSWLNAPGQPHLKSSFDPFDPSAYKGSNGQSGWPTAPSASATSIPDVDADGYKKLQEALKNAGDAAKNAQPSIDNAGSALSNTGNHATNAATGVNAASDSLQYVADTSQSTAPGIQAIGTSMNTVGPAAQQAGNALQQTGDAAAQAAPAIQQAGMALQQAGSSTGASGIGGLGGINWGSMGSSLIMGGLGLGLSLLTKGGQTSTTTTSYNTPVAFKGVTIPNYPITTTVKYHDGLNDDEFHAILQRGEKVLTDNDNERTKRVMKSAADSGGQRSGGTVNMYVQTPDAQSFQRSQTSTMARMSAGISRAASRSK